MGRHDHDSCLVRKIGPEHVFILNRFNRTTFSVKFRSGPPESGLIRLYRDGAAVALVPSQHTAQAGLSGVVSDQRNAQYIRLSITVLDSEVMQSHLLGYRRDKKASESEGCQWKDSVISVEGRSESESSLRLPGRLPHGST